MSTHTVIQCDYCDDEWLEDDAPYTESINACDNYYDDVCEYCRDNNFSYCEWCDQWIESACCGTTYCDNLSYPACNDCIGEAHEAEDEFNGYCDACGYEDDSYLPPVVGAWAGVIG